MFVVSFRTWHIQNRRQKYPEVYDTAEMYSNSNYEIGGQTNEPNVNVIVEVEVQVPEVQSPGFEVEVEVPQVEVDLNAEVNVEIQVE